MRIVWRSLAIADLTSLREYIADHDPVAAARINQRLQSAARQLATMPQIGRAGRVADTRELVVPRTPYLIAYRIRGDRVEILRVLHGARRWPTNIP
jgi:addiction module RelE/StbE family toxin